MKIASFTGLALWLCGSGTLMAFTSPTAIKSAGGGRLTGGLILQDAEYETDASDFDVEGQLLAVGYRTGVSPQLSLGGGLAFMIDGELGDRFKVDDGTGFRLHLDGGYEAWAAQNNRFIVSFGLLHDRFEFEQGAQNPEFTMTDITVGGLFAHQVNAAFGFYAGLNLYLYSDGELESGNTSVDAERGSRIALDLGATFAVSPKVDLRADLALLNEQTLMLAADFSL